MAFDPSCIDAMDFLNCLDIRNAEYATEEEIRFSCPFPGHSTGDDSPSAYMNAATKLFFCHSCLHGDEEVLTKDGLVSIKDIEIGQSVVGVDGKFYPVTNHEARRGDLITIKTGVDRLGIRLTPDHPCLVVTKENAIKHVRGIGPRSGRNGITFNSNNLSSSVSALDIVKAEDVRPGDFFVTPIIESRKSKALSGYSRATRKGPQDHVITELPIDEESCWAYGLFLAEGSYSTRGVRIDLHENEYNLAEKWLRILREKFDVNGLISRREGSKGIYVTVNSVDLNALFSIHFGVGCANKHVPAESFCWPQQLQRALVDGYLDGDADVQNKNVDTVSRSLAYGIWHLSIQSGRHVTVTGHLPRQTGGGVKSRRFVYRLCFAQKNRVRCFYANIRGREYNWSIVEKVETGDKDQVVYDISVERAESFVTKTAVVHNCHAKGSAVDFAAKVLEVSPLEATRLLRQRYSPGAINPDSRNILEEIQKILNPPEPVPEENPILDKAVLKEFQVDWDEAYHAYCIGEGAPMTDYMFIRGFTKKTLKEWEFGYDSASSRIVLPVYDEDDNLVGFKARAWDGRKPKYLNLGGKRYGWPSFLKNSIVFGLNRVIEKGHTDLIVVEGELNAVALWQHGYTNAVAINGSYYGPKQLQLLKSHAESVTLFFDSDEAGFDATSRLNRELKDHLFVRVVPEHKGDPADMTADDIFECLDNAITSAQLSLV